LAADKLAAAAAAILGTSMRIEIQLRIVGNDDSVISANGFCQLSGQKHKMLGFYDVLNQQFSFSVLR
jgi:hypothetical protein